MQSYRPAIFLILGLITLALVGAAAWRGQLPDTSFSVLPSLTPSSTVDPSWPTPPIIEYASPSASWQTFSSASLGYAVSYPPDWVRGKCEPSCVGWKPADASQDGATIGITVTSEKFPDVLARAQPYLVSSASFQFTNVTWVRLFLRHPESHAILTSHFAQHGDQLFEFGTSISDPEFIPLYASMIRSFRTIPKK